jgi:NAD(P)-dependent dehydrogenase (short-subunit alcohol dehydrogenase family)
VDPKGKAALITGGARIGQAVADALARRGCHVAVTYLRSQAQAEAVVQQARSRGVKGAALKADVRREEEGDRVVAETEKSLGRLDILINMASVYRKTPLADLSRPMEGAALWEDGLGTDLRGAYQLSLKAAPLLRRQGSGRIVNFSDWIAASGRPRYKDYVPYYVAKSGVKALTEALALELAPEVLVNAVAPGPILPPADLSAPEAEEAVKNTPLRRWGGAEEVVKAVLFLIETDFVTGECLRVDGGRHLY